jgi:hypothetical protein
MEYKNVELHLSPSTEFTRKYGKKVKAVGGNYSQVRGNSFQRFVTVPASEKELIDNLVTEFPKRNSNERGTVMILRDLDDAAKEALKCGGSVQAWATVYYHRHNSQYKPSQALFLFFEKKMEQCKKLNEVEVE